MSTTILLARHGETDWNREGRFQGHADPPLNATGRAQSERLAAQLAGGPVAAVYASDLRRAAQTAEIVATPRGLRVTELRDLREADVGELTGLTRSEIETRFPDIARRAARNGYTFAAGEGAEALSARVLAALRAIARNHCGATVLVVTHGGPIRAVLAYAHGAEIEEHRRRLPPAANGSVVRLATEGDSLRRLD